jgi:hypothetical protein
MIEGEWNIENAVELTEEAEKVLVYNNFIYPQIWTQGLALLKPFVVLYYIIKHSLEMVLF